MSSSILSVSTAIMGVIFLPDLSLLVHFPEEDQEADEDDVIKVAVIGKPNAGKSSLINH